MQGEHARCAPPFAQPALQQVETAIKAASRRDFVFGSPLALMVTIAADFGPRPGQKLDIGAIDVDLRERRILVTRRSLKKPLR